jgi:hypothetical protein
MKRLSVGGSVALLVLLPAMSVGCGSDRGAKTTEAAPAATSAPAARTTLVPTDYRQLLPAGVSIAAAVNPLCRRWQQTFAHWEASLQPQLARLNAIPVEDPRYAADYVEAHHLAQTDNNGAFARRVSALADARLRELAGRRARFVTGDMVHEFKPNAIAACKLERAFDRASKLASAVDLRVTALLGAASQER